VLVQCYKALEQAFNLTLGSSADAKSVTRPKDILVRFGNRLDLPPYVQAICTDVVVAARENSIADGRSPSSIVGAIYFACLLLGLPKAIKEIAAQGVSEGTIKRFYRLYYTDQRKLVKDEWVKEGKVADRFWKRELVTPAGNVAECRKKVSTTRISGTCCRTL
jgi:transcription initiation factor TFIIB